MGFGDFLDSVGGWLLDPDPVHHLLFKPTPKPQPILPPETDPRYKALQQEQIKGQAAFRQNIPGQAESLLAGEKERGRQELSRAMASSGRDFNRRGLLYGGQRMASAAGTGTDIANRLAQQRYGKNLELRDVADAMTRQAIETGFGIQGAGAEGFSAAQRATQARDDYERGKKNEENKQLQQSAYQIGKGLGQGQASGWQ